MLKISYAQLNYHLGDVMANVEKIHHTARQESSNGSDMVVFSELCLSGYFPGELLLQPQFLTLVARGIQKIQQYSKQYPELYLVIGAPVEQQGSRGKGVTNQLLVIKDGAVVLSYAKQLLPTYNIFYEGRYFDAGSNTAEVLTINGVRVGFLICEDCWGEQLKLYAADPLAQLQHRGIDLLISINASPSYLEKHKQRHSLFSGVARRLKAAVLWVNQVGAIDQSVFDGASFAINADGELIQQAMLFKEQVQQLQWHCSSWRLHGEQLTSLPCAITEPVKYDLVLNQLIFGLREYMQRSGFKKVLVGSSGGIDSALTLALATLAVGADNVHAITLPSQYSSSGSVTDSEKLCANLNVVLDTVAIEPIVAAYQQQFKAAVRQNISGVAAENLQSRVRGTVLMSYANQFGHLLLTTGNKSEIAVGYCTLYGDTNGGLNLLGDLYKTEVFELSRYLNYYADKELIPPAIISKEPSAELAPGQYDRNSLPPYEVLDKVLLYLLEYASLAPQHQNRLAEQIEQLTATAEGQKILAQAKKLLAASEFKRFQAAPIIHLREKAFGIGRQMPLVAKHCY